MGSLQLNGTSVRASDMKGPPQIFESSTLIRQMRVMRLREDKVVGF